MTRVGLIGHGSMGKNHARVVESLPDFTLVGVFDSLAELEIKDLGRTFIENLQDFQGLADYVVVATPTTTHKSIAVELANLGITALIEKPLAASLTDSLEIARAFQQSSGQAFVGHVERFNPALAGLNDKLKTGLIGSILQVSSFRHGPFLNRISDVGVGLDLLSHDIDLCFWLTGSDYATISANSLVKSNGSHEDALEVIARLVSGVLVTHSTNRISPTKRRQTFVWGTEGLLVADSLKSELTLFSNGDSNHVQDPVSVFRGMAMGDATSFNLAHREPLAMEHLAMRDELAGAKSALASIESGVKVLSALARIEAAGT